MLKNAIYFVMIIFLTPCILFSETHVGGEIEGEVVWDVDGSPYIVDESITFGEDGADLTIEAGVTVQFTDFTGIYSEYGGSVTAEGTPEDSIYFIPTPIDARWSGIKIHTIPSSGSFDYCYFYRSFGHHESDPTLTGFYSSFELKHSTIRDASLLIMNCNLSSVIEDCLFTGLILNGIVAYVREDSITVRRCVFAANSGWGYGVISTYKGIIDHCIFYNTRCATGTRNTPGGTVTNSIFYCDEYREHAAVSSYPLIVSNNCVYNRADIISNEMEGVGIIDCVNANGDSTDRFGNMLLDPQFVGLIDSVYIYDVDYIYPDSYCLTEDSPCIDAGDPEADPDPDGTCVDMGPFFFPQQNISVDPDTLEFTGIQTG
ncbi:right-handed parallel beta-helix repeat-containing protein, partial [bacterium]|nr:right-handed parallel beta-helix repeat-containing protein [bacterium]